MQIVLEAAAGHPEGKAIEIAAIGQQRVSRHAALGFEIMPERGDVVPQGGKTGGGFGW